MLSPSSAQLQSEAMAGFQPGLWEVRGVERGSTRLGALCLGNPYPLAQIQHGKAACTRTIEEADRRSATVHYHCPSRGFGRTRLRLQTPRLVTIDSQGIFANAPFAFRAEARRVRACNPATARARP